MAGAAGGFIARSFESMLKECSGKKHTELQKAIQAYFDSIREADEQSLLVMEGDRQRLSTGDDRAEKEKEGTTQNGSDQDSSAVGETDRMDPSMCPTANIAAALSSAGNTLEGSQSELVLKPLQLAFETKNIKLVEPALDCLHKLIAYDHLEGDLCSDGSRNCTVFADILNMVCGCVDNLSADSTILHVLKVLLTAVASNKFRVHGESLLGVIRVCYNIALNSKSPINQATSKAMLTQIINIVFKRVEADQAISRVDQVKATSSAACPSNFSTDLQIPSANALGLSDEKDIMDIAERGKDDVLVPSVEDLQNLSGVVDIKGLEAVLTDTVETENGEKISRGIGRDSARAGSCDALLLFRMLCKMAMKEENDDVTVKTRLLSLELLQGLLEGSSHSFVKDIQFINSVKAYISHALLRASLSSSAAVFQYATTIFLLLLMLFRECLKVEVGVFFPLIILRILDSTECSIEQRIAVLRMLEKFCKNPQLLVDVFVNYDCDLEAPNLFERTVHAVSKIAQGTLTTDPHIVTSSQVASLKGSALQCLVSVLSSLVKWEKSRRKHAMLGVHFQSEENVVADELAKHEFPSHFEKNKAHKSTREAAILEFNRDPVKGVEYLIANNLAEPLPSSVASFLMNTPSLDKAMIGEYLGQHEEFPLAVMHAYVDSMNFAEMKFDTAIRKFLSGFRLPGEAQKIDRFMHKFAARYCVDNPGTFKNGDTAYRLAYAVIILNTDAHNPMVFPKMSKSDFIKLNAVEDAEECAPTELLEEIYDSIVSEEIRMKNDSKTSKEKHEMEEKGRLISVLNLALPRSKSASDLQSENDAIIKQAQNLLKNQGGENGVFYTVQMVELVRPMLDAVGWPLLAAFSVSMEEGENKHRVVLCMEGFRSGIYITRVLGMDTMRYAFLTSLVRFTFLHAPKEMRSKNVEALRTLLNLCTLDIDCLLDTWNAVLECVSRLEYIISNPAIASTVMQGSNQISKDAVLQSLKELAGKPLEQVFINSVKLPSDSIIEFFSVLCAVSVEELKQLPARIFSLQKLVEISYYNMARIRMVWARIWCVLSHHFISAGSHQDEKVAMYAIDSLRQLGIKYLERAELSNFTFQNDILKPFVVLIRKSRSVRIRKLIVDCVVQMIKSKVGSIKSGWRSVFMIFTAASDDEIESIVETAFEHVEQVILEHFDQVVGDCFMDCVNCLIGFANNKSSSRISLKAVALLRICEDRLAEGLIPGGALKPVNVEMDPNLDVTEHFWFPMLAGLSDLTSDHRMEVRNCALEVLFDLLNERGHKFSSRFWESIFHRVLFPIFDHVRYAGKDGFIPVGDEMLREASVHSLKLLCNLFNSFYKEVSFILPSLLGLLLDCAKKTDQSVVSISLGALIHLIDVGGHQFTDSDWDTLLRSIRDASYATQPLELLNVVSCNYPTVMNDSAFVRSDSLSIDSHKTESHLIRNKENEDATKRAGPKANDGSPGNDLSPIGEAGSTSIFEAEEASSNASGVNAGSKPTDVVPLDKSLTFSQRFMGNMMDTLLIRSLTSKPRSRPEDILLPSSLDEVHNAVASVPEEETEDPRLQTIRCKCITQLLLLNAIDSVQKNYWEKLKVTHKISVMETLLSVLEFAASYNSFANLRRRMHDVSPGRPPFNLLRQEIMGTSIYLDVLQKATSIGSVSLEKQLANGSHAGYGDSKLVETDEMLKNVAEEKFVSFCEQALKDVAGLQLDTGEFASVEIHRVLELRSPVIIQILQGMSGMNRQIFKRHLGEFYPLLTKLVCCDQMEVRGALGNLFTLQFTALLPQSC